MRFGLTASRYTIALPHVTHPADKNASPTAWFESSEISPRTAFVVPIMPLKNPTKHLSKKAFDYKIARAKLSILRIETMVVRPPSIIIKFILLKTIWLYLTTRENSCKFSICSQIFIRQEWEGEEEGSGEREGRIKRGRRLSWRSEGRNNMPQLQQSNFHSNSSTYLI